MAISREDKIIGSAIIGAILLIAFVSLSVWLGIKLNQEKGARKEDRALYNKLVQEKFLELANQRKALEIKVAKRELQADSILRINALLEEGLKKMQINDQKKLRYIEKINTYSARQRYADSLAGTIH